jgi:hypothetical protein
MMPRARPWAPLATAAVAAVAVIAEAEGADPLLFGRRIVTAVGGRCTAPRCSANTAPRQTGGVAPSSIAFPPPPPLEKLLLLVLSPWLSLLDYISYSSSAAA